MDINFKALGQRVREARQYNHMTADVLAERIGIETESLRHIERADRKSSLQTLYKISVVLNVSMDYLTGKSPSIVETVIQSHNVGLSEPQEQLLHELVDSFLPILTKYI